MADDLQSDFNNTMANNTEMLKQLQKMFSEIQLCFIEGPYGLQCSAAVTDKYMREFDFMKNLVYPWKNYDWDYQEYVKTHYNTKKLEVSDKPTITAIIKNVDAMIKIIDGLIFKANPNNSSSASNPKSFNNDLADCLNQAGGLSCRILNAAKQSNLSQKKPYENSFFQKPTEGKSSSSYFVQVGVCPTDIKDEPTCREKGYQWIENPLAKLPSLLRGPTTTSGSCFRGKYAYMDNKPGFPIGQIKDLNGLIPSMAHGMLSVSPDKIMATAMGINTPDVSIQKCDEGFSNLPSTIVSKIYKGKLSKKKHNLPINNSKWTNNFNYLSLSIILIIIMLIVYYLSK